MSKQVILYQGEKFAEDGSGKFAKDIMGVGTWFDPKTSKAVPISRERIQRLSTNTRKLMETGTKIPFRDGHRNSVLANMGEWTGGFIPFKDTLVAVCEPKDPKAILGMRNGSIDSVSAVIEYGYVDSKGNKYDEVITSVDATDFPVITGQNGFVELSREHDGHDVLVPESLMLAKGDSDSDGDCMAQHDALHGDLKSKLSAFSKAKAKNGADHADTKAAGSKAQEAAMRLRKQAQVVHDHVQNMTGGPAYYDRVPTVAEAFLELSASRHIDVAALAEALKV